MITIDDLLLYSQCPMKLFFKRIGVSSNNTTTKGQINDAIRRAAYTFLSNMHVGRTAYATAVRNFNTLVGGIILPSEVRGSEARRSRFQRTIDSTRTILDRFMEEMVMMGGEVVGAPYTYNLTINNMSYPGIIDAVISRDGIHDVVTFDFSSKAPTDEILSYSIKDTLAAYAYREISQDPYRLIHYWAPGNQYLEVSRMDGQFNALVRELTSLARLVDMCVDDNMWYRSKGFWCGGCYLVTPCNEIRV